MQSVPKSRLQLPGCFLGWQGGRNAFRKERRKEGRKEARTCSIYLVMTTGPPAHTAYRGTRKLSMQFRRAIFGEGRGATSESALRWTQSRLQVQLSRSCNVQEALRCHVTFVRCFPVSLELSAGAASSPFSLGRPRVLVALKRPCKTSTPDMAWAQPMPVGGTRPWWSPDQIFFGECDTACWRRAFPSKFNWGTPYSGKGSGSSDYAILRLLLLLLLATSHSSILQDYADTTHPRVCPCFTCLNVVLFAMFGFEPPNNRTCAMCSLYAICKVGTSKRLRLVIWNLQKSVNRVFYSWLPKASES